MSKLRVEEVTPEVALRLYQRSELRANGCMIWQGMIRSVYEWHYPMMNVANQKRYTRDVAWIIKHDLPIPQGGVSPSCGDYRCVAPSHQVPKYKRR